MRAALLLLMLAACDPPAPTITYTIADSQVMACGGASCADVTLSCAAVASIRIVDPNDPKTPFISQCEDLVLDRPMDLCSLSQLVIEQTSSPAETLEVEIVIYPSSAIPRETTPGETHDHPVCPATVKFTAADGFPENPIFIENTDDTNTSVTAAIGGRAYYHKGDSEVTVALGCPDISLLDGPACSGKTTIPVSSEITDFDTQTSVSSVLANRLNVSIGEPQQTTAASGGGIEYVLNPADTEELARVTPTGPVPAWGGNVDLTFEHAACLEVLDDVSGATATVACKRVSPQDTTIDITGVHVAKATLDQILAALGNPPLDQGLVLGIVLEDGTPPTNPVTVTTDQDATIRYLSADGLNFDAPATTASGIFVSRDAPFGTQFTVNAGTTAFAFGGLVDNKVNVVLIELTGGPPSLKR